MKLKVILRQDIEKRGKKYDIVELSGGYANNFLIPKGLAVLATPEKLREREECVRQAHAKAALLRQTQVDLARQLEAEHFVLKVKTSEQGKFYGNITALQVVGVLQEKHPELTFRHQDVYLKESIQSLGDHKATLHLPEGVKATIHLRVKAA